ncbi:hypothetical protein BCON_0087g00290 [Botryotinia convoluta]|uniref:Uncharacterized protein n=1 Tax=Botryotinia convoluta TaxID=54673 RepID=A0A4Z1I369_9HELO|nr:hypothetical protein BCON_0087g00290 [Botryotinia convoluta]
MAPKAQRVVVERSGRRPAQPKGYFASTYTALTAPENASVVRSIGVFGIAVAFFSSSWSEYLLPPIGDGDGDGEWYGNGISICGIDKGKAEEMMMREGIPLMTTTMYNGLGRR